MFFGSVNKQGQYIRHLFSLIPEEHRGKPLRRRDGCVYGQLTVNSDHHHGLFLLFSLYHSFLYHSANTKKQNKTKNSKLVFLLKLRRKFYYKYLCKPFASEECVWGGVRKRERVRERKIYSFIHSFTHSFILWFHVK